MRATSRSFRTNRALIEGARVLDLASHDGRFSFAALQNGAASVIGIEHEPHLVTKANENMEHLRGGAGRYQFLLGDMFDLIPQLELACDVVFCFGILYHINDHMRLLQTIAEHTPKTLIIDSNMFGTSSAPRSSSHPSRAIPHRSVRDSKAGRAGPASTRCCRASAGRSSTSTGPSPDSWIRRRWTTIGSAGAPTVVVECNERIDPDVRDRAVQQVLHAATGTPHAMDRHRPDRGRVRALPAGVGGLGPPGGAAPTLNGSAPRAEAPRRCHRLSPTRFLTSVVVQT